MCHPRCLGRCRFMSHPSLLGPEAVAEADPVSEVAWRADPDLAGTRQGLEQGSAQALQVAPRSSPLLARAGAVQRSSPFPATGPGWAARAWVAALAARATQVALAPRAIDPTRPHHIYKGHQSRQTSLPRQPLQPRWALRPLRPLQSPQQGPLLHQEFLLCCQHSSSDQLAQRCSTSYSCRPSSRPFPPRECAAAFEGAVPPLLWRYFARSLRCEIPKRIW
jgi:hypothetical protein